MEIQLDDAALKKAAEEMEALITRNKTLRAKLEEMYTDLVTALDTPAGHAIEWQGRELLLEPIDDMNKVLQHVSDTLNLIIGRNVCSMYYGKVFEDYQEMDRLIKNKTVKK